MTERHTDFRDLPPSVAARLRLHDAKAEGAFVFSMPPLTAEQADELRAEWSRLHGKTAA